MTYKASLQKLMKSHGFELHRSKKHLIWVNTHGQKIVTPATPSCSRTIDNVKRNIRRLTNV